MIVEACTTGLKSSEVKRAYSTDATTGTGTRSSADSRACGVWLMASDEARAKPRLEVDFD
jgi:hypothetical protein